MNYKRIISLALILSLALLSACAGHSPLLTEAPPPSEITAAPAVDSDAQTLPGISFDIPATQAESPVETSAAPATALTTEVLTEAPTAPPTEPTTEPTTEPSTEAPTEVSTEAPTEASETPAPESSTPAESESIAETTEAINLPFITVHTGKTETNRGWIESFNEGEDTPCRVSGYSPYQGPLSDYFPRKGERIAVIAPSTLPSWGSVNAVMKGLESWGYVPVAGQYVSKTNRSLQNCIDDMIWALTDPSIQGIFCVTGGYGASEIMDGISLDLIRRGEKPIIGYSDISVFHAAWSVAGLPSIHGAMDRNFTNIAPDCVSVIQKMMEGQRPLYHCAGFGENLPGSAEGILIGGNLSTLVTVLNTAYDCTALQEPYILFFEDVTADMEQIHRYLTVLQHSGAMDKAAGIIFGEWIDVPLKSEIIDGSSRGGPFRSVADMLRRSFFPESNIPIAFGFPAGHGDVNYPLLMGSKVRMQVSNEGLTLEWID